MANQLSTRKKTGIYIDTFPKRQPLPLLQLRTGRDATNSTIKPNPFLVKLNLTYSSFLEFTFLHEDTVQLRLPYKQGSHTIQIPLQGSHKASIQ